MVPGNLCIGRRGKHFQYPVKKSFLSVKFRAVFPHETNPGALIAIMRKCRFLDCLTPCQQSLHQIFEIAPASVEPRPRWGSSRPRWASPASRRLRRNRTSRDSELRESTSDSDADKNPTSMESSDDSRMTIDESRIQSQSLFIYLKHSRRTLIQIISSFSFLPWVTS